MWTQKTDHTSQASLKLDVAVQLSSARWDERRGNEMLAGDGCYFCVMPLKGMLLGHSHLETVTQIEVRKRKKNSVY